MPDVSARAQNTDTQRDKQIRGLQSLLADKDRAITTLQNEIEQLKKTIHQTLTETKVNEINVQNLINNNVSDLKGEINVYKKRVHGLEQRLKRKETDLQNLRDQINLKVQNKLHIYL